ncbi:MAG: hypothetical protein BWY92_01219 [Firmicutes bacterium ADurb.BinA052]|nr:MAG: hypothetical protein BWY92_01219 [Firmicutes bacterium ADurb.BinA052]
MSCRRVAPSDRICTRIPGSSCPMPDIVSPVMMGRAMRVWAITMAVGVYMRRSEPRGPYRHSTMLTQSPTTTGGSPMPVFTMLATASRPRNLPRARAVPSGTPIARLIRVASPDTLTVRRAIWRTPRSPFTSSRKACVIPSAMRSKVYLLSEIVHVLAGIREEQRVSVFVHAEGADDLLHFRRYHELDKGKSARAIHL